MEFSISFKIDHTVAPRSTAGSNRLYNLRKEARYFLLDFSELEKQLQIYIHTNDRSLIGFCTFPIPYVVHSTSKRPNMKFLISHCLTFILTHANYGNKLPKYARDRYFSRIRTLLCQQ